MSFNARKLKTSPGCPLPLGANFAKSGIQFSIFSRHATAVTLILFESDRPDSEQIKIPLDSEINKTGDIWHILVHDLTDGQLYGYKIDGPYEPHKGQRYNSNKLILDPRARAVTGTRRWDLTKALGYDPDSLDLDLSFSEIDNTPFMPKCIAVATSRKTRGRSPRIPERDSIIYELHLKGFTWHPSSKVRHRGTYRGLVEKIPYLKELGVNVVELMPVQEFDDEDNTNINPGTGEKLKNFWGYNTIAFFAPKGTYASAGCMGEQVVEFSNMVHAFHEAGIEVILDVVFNHTAEGDEIGPTISFRGIDNSLYYILKEDKRYYKNFSGCGNTFNCNHPLVREFILDALRYWVIEMNVDGFRFDLASILGRDQNGNIMSNPPLIEKIGEDPILRNTKIIAEAWDAAGAYQVGGFPGRWAEWNGRYRDDIRKFWRGDRNSVGSFATRVTGSSDLYGESGKGPLQSINFITCHDGFTLNDLVSYSEKHNIENGENNLDGEDENLSCNWGIEGPDSSTLIITRVRVTQIKNFIATLLLSQGIPMLLAGDEFRRTQKGNNNAYCQDNEISWVDWRLFEKNRDIVRFAREMIRFRKNHPVLRKGAFFTGEVQSGKKHPDISWHGHAVGEPDWGPESRSIAMLISGEYAELTDGKADADLYAIFNASRTGREYDIPESPSCKPWKIAVDTSKHSPDDVHEPGKEPLLEGKRYFVNELCTVVLISD
ncbi:MAG: glycogen debranching enzyme GlgX [Spirochaetes bacterium RBG_13_51_14]|nr:MAG: glycogen debranching enzyme GlgX [Spirochaetes bacterium RBG_13_51_14]